MHSIANLLKKLFPAACHDRIVLVGGTVRDLLLNKTPHDIDLTAALSDDELGTAGFQLVEATGGAAIFFKYHPESGKIEITRIDSMAELTRDLRRRDFTANAMAMDLRGNLIDPLGGKEELSSQTLRACSDQTFNSDPLRIFRAFRFEAAGWKMTPETAGLIEKQPWSIRLAAMPMERFSNEMLKALRGCRPERFFELMIEHNIGSEFLPELFRMPHIPAGPPQHHPEGDLLTHSVQVLQRVAALSDNPLALFCAFFHDLGKLATDPALYPKHHGHDNAGFSLAVDFCNRLCLPAAYRTALAWTSSLHGKANLWETLRDATKLTMAEQALKAGITDILPLVAAADKAGGPPMVRWYEAVRIAGLNTRELGIDQEKLEVMPTGNRAAHILQKRVESLRERNLSRND